MRDSKKIDRRVIYTKKAIRDSFIALQQEKPIEKISVTEICRLADINRGTFYSHYSDPYSLRTSLQQELVDAIEERVRESGKTGLSFVETFELFRDHKELCRIFAGPYADKAALLEIVSKQADGFLADRSNFTADIPEKQVDYLRMLMVSAIAIAVKEWFDEGLTTDPAEIASILETFCFCGIRGFSDQAD